MTMLWVYIALLSVAALGFLVIPVLRFRDTRVEKSVDAELRTSSNKALFKQRMAEVEQDVANGVTDAEEAERIRTELKRSFLNDMKDVQTRPASVSSQKINSGSPAFILILVILVPLFSLWMYSNWGAHRDLKIPEQLDLISQAETEEEVLPLIEEFAETIQARYDRNPDDVQNGFYLGTIYMDIGELEKAEEIFIRLSESEEITTPQDQASVLGQLTLIQYVLADRTLTAEVRAKIDEALALNPNQRSVMRILAEQSLLAEDYAAALSFARRELTQLTPGSPEALRLQDNISLLAQYVPQEDLATDVVTEGPSITVNVDVSDELREQAAGKRVFVFARNPAGGPPLAVQELTAGELPATVVLDNSKAMMPQMNLSSAAGPVVIGARISENVANAESGDLEAFSDPVVPDELDGPLNLVISEIVP